MTLGENRKLLSERDFTGMWQPGRPGHSWKRSRTVTTFWFEKHEPSRELSINRFLRELTRAAEDGALGDRPVAPPLADGGHGQFGGPGP